MIDFLSHLFAGALGYLICKVRFDNLNYDWYIQEANKLIIR